MDIKVVHVAAYIEQLSSVEPGQVSTTATTV